MKCFRLLMIAALCLAAGVARGEVYGYDEPAAEATPHADEVIVGDEGVPAGAPVMDHYGYAPSWSGGCCERVASPADHIWDDYCCERHSRFGCWNGCCERSYGCDGPFHKDCCEGGGCLSHLRLPHLHLPRLNCCSQKCCSQKCAAPKCAAPKCATKCSSKCGHGHCLANFRLFRGCGLLHGGKGGKCSKGAAVVEAPAVHEVDEVPMPSMPGDAPPPPPMPDARAA